MQGNMLKATIKLALMKFGLRDSPYKDIQESFEFSHDEFETVGCSSPFHIEKQPEISNQVNRW